MSDYIKQLQESQRQLQDEILALKAENSTLRKKLRAANDKLAAFTNRANKEYRFQQDYLPYDDDERE
jgi:septal ring factor EnvC (AmiA/AmiB activator)